MTDYKGSHNSETVNKLTSCSYTKHSGTCLTQKKLTWV